MFGAKKKTIGGKAYMVIGGKIDYSGNKIVKKTYDTTEGIVIVENGKVLHPDKSITYDIRHKM